MFKKRVKKDATSKRKLDLLDGEEDETIVDMKRKRIFKTALGSVKTVQEDDVLNTPQNDEAPKPKPKLKPASDNIKTITITDFQPDVCKDFLQTGYCGYGDTCKFLHIRDELKQNKPIVKDWQLGNDKVEEELPFKCVICKEDYKTPIKTQCGHPFCKDCFLTRYRKNKHLCFICKKETNGVFLPVKMKPASESTKASSHSEKVELG